MKKLFLIVCLLFSVALSSNAEFRDVDFDYEKMIVFDALYAPGFSESIIDCPGSRMLLNYKDYGTAGSICTLSISINGLDSVNGDKVSRYEDCILRYDPETKNIGLINKFNETIFLIANVSQVTLVIKDDMLLINQASDK